MTRRTLVLGDLEHDPLLAELVPRLDRTDRCVTVVEPAAVAELGCTADPSELHVGSASVDEVVFRLSLELLIAPSFVAEDRSFVTNELRALWTHALALPTVATLNDGRATSALLRDPGAWRSMLRDDGVAVAPATTGTPPPDSWWLRERGDVVALPPPAARRPLGVTSVRATGLRAVLCCAGDARDDAVRRAARALACRGVGLAEVVVDDQDRVISVLTEPAVGAGDATWAAERAEAWLDAAARR